MRFKEREEKKNVKKSLELYKLRHIQIKTYFIAELLIMLIIYISSLSNRQVIEM
jgi:hypothetical protein